MLLCIKSSGVWKYSTLQPAEYTDTAHFLEVCGIFRQAMYFKKTISLSKCTLTYHCKNIRLINVTPPLYLYFVSPHWTRLIPAWCGPPALSVRMKSRGVFLQSAVALGLFWHILTSHQIPVMQVLSTTSKFKTFQKWEAFVFEEQSCQRVDFNDVLDYTT